MTKLIALRLTIAADDGVELKDVKARLSAMITERGTEATGENGSGRIHWGTAELLQGPERAPLRRSKRRDEGPALPGV
jgi:hypothetical protein